jgi:hypothetical protein
MTQTVVRPPTIDFPTPQQLPGSLLAIVAVQEGVGFLEPAGLAESYNCLILDSVPTWPCPPNSLGAPTSSASSTATTGGTLPAGTYRAKITAVNDRGETVGSTEQSQTTTGSASTVTFNWGAVSGATGYRVYLTNGASGSEAQYVTDSASPYVLTAWPPAGATAASPPSSGTATVSVQKNFEKSSWQDGFRFSVYGGITCKGPGFDMAEAETKTKTAFLAMESVGVERALMTTRFVAGAGWSAPTDVTPAGGAVTPAVGLALLEGDAACKYAGSPIIHAPRQVASLLTGTLGTISIGPAGKLVTGLGTRVAAGGGYGCPNQGPTGSAPTAGEFWMFASGEVVVARSDVFTASDLDRSTNDVYVLVERTYVAVVDCYTAAVRVKVA